LFVRYWPGTSVRRNAAILLVLGVNRKGLRTLEMTRMPLKRSLGQPPKDYFGFVGNLTHDTGGHRDHSGTLFASGAHSLIDIVGGATVTGGGIAKIGNGIIDIEGAGDNQNVIFQSGAQAASTSACSAAPTPASSPAFGQNIHQFIDFTAIGSTGATFTSWDR
jgi:hypothetical protein